MPSQDKQAWISLANGETHMKIISRLKDRLFSFIYYDCERVLFSLRKRFADRTAASEPIEFGVNYVGYAGSSKGLGEAARSIMKIVRAAGISLAINAIEHRWQRSDETQFASVMQGNPYSINIFHVNADMVFHVLNSLGRRWSQRRYNIGYWVWELDKFPSQWAASSRCFDEIWTPSEFCSSAIKSVSAIPVNTMPHSVDISVEGPCDKSLFGIPEDSFVFLYVFDFFSHFERKNPLAVIEAFRRAFPARSNRNTILALKFTGGHAHPRELKKVLDAANGLPVRMFDYHMDRNDVYKLMSASDCYVSLHRSEGFGLTIAEAMSLGKPALATAYSGNMEFMNEQNSLPVKYSLKSIGERAGPYKKGNVWAEPDVDHAARLMRRVADDPQTAKELGAAAARHMKDHFSPSALSVRLEEFIHDIRKKHG